MNLNDAKLHSPIILVDPTYKQRNVLAALSKETFEIFQTECRKFIKKPSLYSFESKQVDLDKIKPIVDGCYYYDFKELKDLCLMAIGSAFFFKVSSSGRSGLRRNPGASRAL